MAIDYSAAPVPVREDLLAAHRRCWERLRAPGTWWTGPERIAIAEAARAALTCPVCAERNAALSPHAGAFEHVASGPLPGPVVDIVHRVRTDSSRLDHAWYQRVVPAVLSEGAYVEAVAIVANVATVDTFCQALGVAPHSFLAPLEGAPTRRRPAGAKAGLAWVPTVAPEDLTEAEPDIYADKSAANIHRALSLVPDEVVGFFDLDDVHYLPDAQLRQFDEEPRAINHAQIELLAARMSALNQCVY